MNTGRGKPGASSIVIFRVKLHFSKFQCKLILRKSNLVACDHTFYVTVENLNAFCLKNLLFCVVNLWFLFIFFKIDLLVLILCFRLKLLYLFIKSFFSLMMFYCTSVSCLTYLRQWPKRHPTVALGNWLFYQGSCNTAMVGPPALGRAKKITA